MQLHLDNCHLAWLDSKPVEMYINANRSARAATAYGVFYRVSFGQCTWWGGGGGCARGCVPRAATPTGTSLSALLGYSRDWNHMLTGGECAPLRLEMCGGNLSAPLFFIEAAKLSAE